MSKSSSRLGRPGSAGSKSLSLRKEPQGNRSCMLRIGERLMRAGSEGNLVQRPIPAQSQSQASSTGLGQESPALEDKLAEHIGNNSSKDLGNNPSRVSSSFSSTAVDSSTERPLQKKPHTDSSLLSNPDFACGSAPRSPSTLPRSYITAARASIRDSQLDSLRMQHFVERKKEVFLDQLRQKYPHNAAIILGQQNCMREQPALCTEVELCCDRERWGLVHLTLSRKSARVEESTRPAASASKVRSPSSTESPFCAGVLDLVEQQDPLASETMSDGEILPSTVPFTRGSRARSSLPVGWSSGQTRARPPGVLYLQYGEETKQVRMPTEIRSQDALEALLVTAFPHQLTMKMLQSPNMAIYIKDNNCNAYYDLEDIRNITSHSYVKVYHRDPGLEFNRHARPANTKGRISKEVLYSSPSPIHSAASGRSTLHNLQGSMSPPMVRSMPSSPSRMAYGGRSTGERTGMVDQGSVTLPRERLSGVGRSSSLCTSSSAILERRDVKPDEDAGSSKTMALVVRGEGGPHYPDSYCSSLQDRGGGHLSMASSRCSAPPSLTADMVDAGVTGIPGGLQQYRASIKPLMGYGESLEQTHFLHRQKSRKYGDSQLPQLGTKTPPPSPHRVNDVRMIEGQIVGGVGLVTPERMSTIRRSLRRDSHEATVEIVNRSRGSGSSSSTSSVFVDSPLGQPERLFHGHVNSSNAQSARMKAMEEQIASLAGLVHSALSMGPDVQGVKDTVSDNIECKLLNKAGVSSEPQVPAVVIDSFSPARLALPAPPQPYNGLQQSLVLAKSNVCDLRLQLNHLRHLQLSNQESVTSMLRMAGQELVVLMYDRLAQSEEAVYRRRAGMEEERIHYLATEERILTQLRELEDYVDCLQRSSASSPDQLSITLRDVEEGAVNLRRAGEALAILKGEFPELQVKMRSVLRLEVEAVRFLKEEPHKMDSMLKRVKALTEVLSCLRRCVSESTNPARSAQVEPLKVLETDQGPLKTQSSPKPQPRSSVRPPLTPSLSGSQAEVSLAGSVSSIMAGRMKTAATVIEHPYHPRPQLTATHGRDSPTVAKVSPRSREGSPALQRRQSPLTSPTQEGHADHTPIKQTTERQTPEGSMNQTSTSQANQPVSFVSSQLPSHNTNTEFDQVPQESQASLMKTITRPNVSDTREGCSDSASRQMQASVEQQARLSDSQEDTTPQLSDEVDSTQLEPSDTAAASQLPAAPVKPLPSASPLAAPLSASPLSAAPPSASPSTEHISRPRVEKPRRTSVDKEMNQSPDRAGKSPPPPPPRRFHAVSSGLTTGRPREMIFTTRKELHGSQDEGEEEKPLVPQPKPPRQQPEVKPKPQMCSPAPLAGSTSSHSTASTHREDVKEEEEEKFMKELQVTTELSNKNNLPGGNNQCKGEVRTSPTSQVANRKISRFATSDHQSTPQTGITYGCPNKVRTAAGLEDHIDVNQHVNQHKDTEETVGKQVPSFNSATKKMEVLRVPNVQKENYLSVKRPDQINKDVVGHVCCPTSAEKKVKFTTIVTLQKENIQATDIADLDQTNENVVHDLPSQKKSHLMVVDKENSPKDRVIELQQDRSLSSGQECVASSPVLKPSPRLTYSHSSKQNQQATAQVSRDPSQYTEEGSRLSPYIWDSKGPPPPPPTMGKIKLRISKTRSPSVRTESRDEDLAEKRDSQTVAGDDSIGEPTYEANDNQAFQDSNDSDKTPFIVILNIPMDIQSADKRLSTILECEEDLDGILSPENIVDEEETKQDEEKQNVRTTSITEINTDFNIKDTRGKGHNFLHMHNQIPSADSVSIPKNRDQGQQDSLRQPETKRKFKFKFPKNKLAAISQAIRTGMPKKGKKTLKVVVYEEEEEKASDSKPVKETKKPTKESKRFETNSTTQFNLGEDNDCDRDIKVSPSINTRQSKSDSRVEELCRNTLDSIDNLEESIKQLEISVDSLSGTSSPSSIVSSPPKSPDSFDSRDRTQLKGKVKRERERSPSKRPASQTLKGPNPPQSKRAKPQPLHNSGKTSTKKQTSSSSSSSSAQQSHTKSRHSSSSSSPEKTPRGQQQATQKQRSQADSRSSRAAGDSNHSVVALRASKTPALCHSSWKHPSASLSTPHCSDTTDSFQNLSSYSSASSPSASSTSSKCPSSPPSLSSTQLSRQQALICPLSFSSLVKNSSPSHSPPRSPSPSLASFSFSTPPHKSFIPSLNLSRFHPSSSHVLSSSHANAGPRSSSKRQHRLVVTSTSTSIPKHSYYSSSSYSSSSTSSSSSSLSPTSSSSSPPSPSSSLLPTMVSHWARSVRMSASKPSSPGRGKKCTGSQAGRVPCTTATASKDAA
ncbi:sickle tail protein homolog [Cyclopterus lumpus]|uniref:sickle tail protein homolog n=1 Tax=Cyclopterus lumpus TaxID=8103 RepID=UPI0014864BAF|nr:sickle tail protein homolog [Cyclopterus lumpus]